MTQTYTATGTLANGTTLTLDERLPILTGKVRLHIEVLPEVGDDSQKSAQGDSNGVLQVLQQIWNDQQARGFVPHTVEEVETMIREGREDRNY